MGSLKFQEALFMKLPGGVRTILAEGVARAAKKTGMAAEEIANAQRMFPYGPKVFPQSALFMLWSSVRLSPNFMRLQLRRNGLSGITPREKSPMYLLRC